MAFSCTQVHVPHLMRGPMTFSMPHPIQVPHPLRKLSNRIYRSVLGLLVFRMAQNQAPQDCVWMSPTGLSKVSVPRDGATRCILKAIPVRSLTIDRHAYLNLQTFAIFVELGSELGEVCHIACCASKQLTSAVRAESVVRSLARRHCFCLCASHRPISCERKAALHEKHVCNKPLFISLSAFSCKLIRLVLGPSTPLVAMHLPRRLHGVIVAVAPQHSAQVLL